MDSLTSGPALFHIPTTFALKIIRQCSQTNILSTTLLLALLHDSSLICGMDTDLLQRARRPNAAAQEIADRLRSSHEPVPPPSSSTSPKQKQDTSPAKESRGMASPSPLVGKGTESHREFKGAAFNGSSLLTTFTDLRPFLNRGDSLLVDGISCAIKADGEFSASRVELSDDFNGISPSVVYYVERITALQQVQQTLMPPFSCLLRLTEYERRSLGKR